MKRIILFSLIQIICATAAFAQSPPWRANGEAISARPDLTVRWQDSIKFPHKVWLYQILPNYFSPKIISDLTMLCSFTEKDEVENDTNGITFQSTNHSRTLSISFPSGNIRYDTPEPHYVLKPNFFEGVPKTEEMPKLTIKFLQKIGIKHSEIQTNADGTPRFLFSERGYEYFPNQTIVTNTWARTVLFRRSVDGAVVIGNTCELYFGEHGQISKIDFSWPNLKRVKSYPTVSQKDVIDFLREGNAIRGPVPTDVGDIDWQSIKSVTIKQAVPSYEMAGDRLFPFLRLDAAIDTGNQTVVIGIDCPIIDETKL